MKVVAIWDDQDLAIVITAKDVLDGRIIIGELNKGIHILNMRHGAVSVCSLLSDKSDPKEYLYRREIRKKLKKAPTKASKKRNELDSLFEVLSTCGGIKKPKKTRTWEEEITKLRAKLENLRVTPIKPPVTQLKDLEMARLCMNKDVEKCIRIPYPQEGFGPSTVTLSLQKGLRSRVGINGLTVTELIDFVGHYVSALNASVPCQENVATMELLARAAKEQENRDSNRTERGVIGTPSR